MRLLLGILTTLSLAMPGATQQPDAGGKELPPPAEQVRQLLEQRRAQTALPGSREFAGETRKPIDTSNRGPRRSPESSQPISGGRPGREPTSSGSGLTMPLLVLVLVLAAALLLVAILRGLRGRAARAETAASPRVATKTLAATAAAPPTTPLDPDQLAAQGHYAAALHALLHQGLALLQQRIGALPQHATARTAVQRARHKDLPAQFLDGVVRANERVLFGGAPAERTHYDAARADFEAWRGACSKTP